MTSRCAQQSAGLGVDRPFLIATLGPAVGGFAALSSDAKSTPRQPPPRAGRRIGAAAYDAKAKEMFDLGRQSRKR
jgi:hypothetical protein